jgi:hypothetical protein
MQGLTEGRIVHFVLPGTDKHRAAIVVNVQDKEKAVCDLFVFSMPQDEHGGFFMFEGAAYDESKNPKTWHWIEPA